MRKNLLILIAMLFMAIVAVGSVSASDDISTDIDINDDDITVEEISVEDPVDEIQQSTSSLHIVDNTTSQSDIDTEISAASADTTNHIVDFTYGTYSGYYFNVQDNVILDGHGSTVIGDGIHDIFLVTGKSNFTIKNFVIDINKTTKGHGVYGHHVYNSVITNNTFYNGEDAVNIYQVHENLTITDNTIYDVSQDGISLVNFNTYSDTEFENFIGSTISGNNITGCQYGMFFGGNFKGTITGNNMTNCEYGMQFSGKRVASNGRLDATISYNNIYNATVGIDMNNPGVDYLNVTHNNISTINQTGFIIANNTYFAISVNGECYINDNYFYGKIEQAFIDELDEFENNQGNITIVWYLLL